MTNLSSSGIHKISESKRRVQRWWPPDIYIGYQLAITTYNTIAHIFSPIVHNLQGFIGFLGFLGKLWVLTSFYIGCDEMGRRLPQIRYRRTGINCIVQLLRLSLFSYIVNLIQYNCVCANCTQGWAIKFANQKFANSIKTCNSQLLDSCN